MSKKKKLKLKRLHAIKGALIVGALVLAAGLGVLTNWLINKQQAPKQADRAQQEARRSGEITSSKADEIQNIRATGTPEQAKAKLDEALNDSSLSNDDKYYVYIQQGLLYESEENFSAALTAYGKARDIKETNEVYELLGDAALGMEDSKKSVEYYQKAISLLPESPAKEAETELLQRKIQDAENV